MRHVESFSSHLALPNVLTVATKMQVQLKCSQAAPALLQSFSLGRPLQSHYDALASEIIKDVGSERKLLGAAEWPEDVVTVVRSPEDFLEALQNEAPHIEIQEHLNLVNWSWSGNFSDWSVLEIPSWLKSLRVCISSPVLPTSSSDAL
jgi:hypothetical protein